MLADLIEFPTLASRHGLTARDVSELRKWAETMPGTWVVETSYEGDQSRLWLRFSGDEIADCPTFGFSRKRGLVLVVIRHLNPFGGGDEWEAPFASVPAAVMNILDAIIESAQPEWGPPDRPAA